MLAVSWVERQCSCCRLMLGCCWTAVAPHLTQRINEAPKQNKAKSSLPNPRFPTCSLAHPCVASYLPQCFSLLGRKEGGLTASKPGLHYPGFSFFCLAPICSLAKSPCQSLEPSTVPRTSLINLQ